MGRQAFPVMACDVAVAATVTQRAVSMDGIDTTPLASGHFAFVTTGALAGTLYRLDTSSAVAPDGLTVVAPLVGPGRWLQFTGASALDTTTEQMMRPEHLAVTGTANKQAEANYIGASFYCERAISFTAISLFIVATGPTAISRFLIYQNPNGVVEAPAPLIAECRGTNTPVGRQNVPIVGGGPAVLARGVYWLLWGIDAQGTGGNVSVNAATTTQLPLFNGNGVVAGDHPSLFRTTVAATTAPDTFDPFIGGASGVSKTSDLVMPFFRLVTP